MSDEKDEKTNKKPPMPKDYDPTRQDPQDVAGIEWTVRDQMQRAAPKDPKISR